MGGSNFRDGVSGIRPVQAFGPATFSASANGAAVDISNGTDAASTSLSFVINVGTFSAGLDGANLITVSFEKDTDSGFGTAVAVPAADIFQAFRSDNTAWDLILDDSADEDTSFKVGVLINDPDREFYRIVLTETGTVTGVIGAVAVLTPDFQPEAN